MEAVLTCTHNLRFEQNEKENQHFLSENYFLFYSREKLQFIIYKVMKYRKILMKYIVYFIFSLHRSVHITFLDNL